MKPFLDTPEGLITHNYPLPNSFDNCCMSKPLTINSIHITILYTVLSLIFNTKPSLAGAQQLPDSLQYGPQISVGANLQQGTQFMSAHLLFPVILTALLIPLQLLRPLDNLQAACLAVAGFVRQRFILVAGVCSVIWLFRRLRHRRRSPRRPPRRTSRPAVRRVVRNSNHSDDPGTSDQMPYHLRRREYRQPDPYGASTSGSSGRSAWYPTHGEHSAARSACYSKDGEYSRSADKRSQQSDKQSAPPPPPTVVYPQLDNDDNPAGGFTAPASEITQTWIQQLAEDDTDYDELLHERLLERELEELTELTELAELEEQLNQEESLNKEELLCQERSPNQELQESMSEEEYGPQIFSNEESAGEIMVGNEEEEEIISDENDDGDGDGDHAEYAEAEVFYDAGIESSCLANYQLELGVVDNNNDYEYNSNEGELQEIMNPRKRRLEEENNNNPNPNPNFSLTQEQLRLASIRRAQSAPGKMALPSRRRGRKPKRSTPQPQQPAEFAAPAPAPAAETEIEEYSDPAMALTVASPVDPDAQRFESFISMKRSQFQCDVVADILASSGVINIVTGVGIPRPQLPPPPPPPPAEASRPPTKTGRVLKRLFKRLTS